MQDKYLWVEKYRPQTIEECILPDSIKRDLQQQVDAGELNNLLLTGPPGVGKTTAAKALCNELGLSYIVINGSDEGRFLDTVRNQAKTFATTVSLQGSKHKVIIIDEADNTGNDVQLLLRSSIEAYHSNCRFIFTCNYKNKIIDPIQSRCSVIDFTYKGKERASVAAQFFDRVREILAEEGVEYDAKVVAELIQRHFPDWRRVLNQLQKYGNTGSINTGILAEISDVNLKELITSLKNKEFNTVRKWVVSNLDNDFNMVIHRIYEAMYDSLVPSTIPAAVLVIAKYQYQAAFAADQEINLLACLTEIMMECEFK
jgi:DNA polymerase III delta prime subunit